MTSRFAKHFLTPEPTSVDSYRRALRRTANEVVDRLATVDAPYSGASPAELSALLEQYELAAIEGGDLDDAIVGAGEVFLSHAIRLTNPACAAHLQCPPLIAGLAAEAMISATNQSLDSFDGGPAATVLELAIVRQLTERVGYDARGDGVFTSGGTQSNLMGLLLARERHCNQRLNWDVQRRGLPPEAGRFRIICSSAAHFSVWQAAALLGLGEEAIVAIDPGLESALCPERVGAAAERLMAEGLTPIALVATAGTTDAGSIDPLPALAQIASRHRMWLHVDAAYGGALLFSDRLRHLLAGLCDADSVAIDFHKLLFQPISCAAFLLRDQAHWGLIRRHAEYLNPAANEQLEIPDLVGKSLQTTRRSDALKVWMTLQSVGPGELAAMIEHLYDLAQQFAAAIDVDGELELLERPRLTTVLFRFIAPWLDDTQLDQLQDRIRAALLASGEVVLARTRIDGRVQLKLTLLNPLSQLSDLLAVLAAVKQAGRALVINEREPLPATPR